MRLVPVVLSLALLAVLAGPAAAFITPIDSLHMNLANGLSKFYSPTPRTVTIQGTVTSPDSIYSKLNTDVYIQDATGGVNVFQSSGISSNLFLYGDSVQVTGIVKMFRGLVEIDSTALTVTHLGAATVVPDTLVLTCNQVTNSMNQSCVSCDPWESRVVRVNGVSITSGSWPTTASPGSSSIFTNCMSSPRIS